MCYQINRNRCWATGTGALQYHRKILRANLDLLDRMGSSKALILAILRQFRHADELGETEMDSALISKHWQMSIRVPFPCSCKKWCRDCSSDLEIGRLGVGSWRTGTDAREMHHSLQPTIRIPDQKTTNKKWDSSQNILADQVSKIDSIQSFLEMEAI